jgi:hypothetical protein
LKTTLNRPYGTYTSIAIYPGLASWAKVNRAYGAARQSDDPFRIQAKQIRLRLRARTPRATIRLPLRGAENRMTAGSFVEPSVRDPGGGRCDAHVWCQRSPNLPAGRSRKYPPFGLMRRARARLLLIASSDRLLYGFRLLPWSTFVLLQQVLWKRGKRESE